MSQYNRRLNMIDNCLNIVDSGWKEIETRVKGCLIKVEHVEENG